MADRKITDLTALAAGSQATGDLITIVDVSESAAADKNKKMTVENLFKGIPGDVGIGTSAPSQKLHIFEATDGDVGIRIQNNDGFAELEVDADELNYNADSHVFNNQADSSEFMRINSSGNLGLGTASPDSPFHVKNSANTVARFESTDSIARIVLKDSSGESRLGTNGNNITFHTSSSETERARIDSDGRLLVGLTSARATKASASIPSFQIEGTGDSDSRMNIGRNSNADNGPEIHLYKTRGSSLGSNTVVQDDDFLGTIGFYGADGSDLFARGAEITAAVDGTPGNDDMPTRLTFGTCADGAASPTERVRIDSSGNVGIGHNNPPKQLSLAQTTQPTIALYTGSTIRAEFNATSAETSFQAIQIVRSLSMLVVRLKVRLSASTAVSGCW